MLYQNKWRFMEALNKISGWMQWTIKGRPNYVNVAERRSDTNNEVFLSPGGKILKAHLEQSVLFNVKNEKINGEYIDCMYGKPSGAMHIHLKPWYRKSDGKHIGFVCQDCGKRMHKWRIQDKCNKPHSAKTAKPSSQE